MAYAITNPPAMVTERCGADLGAIWMYVDGDPIGTVTEVGYIADATELGLKAGDVVIHVDSTLNRTTMLTATAGITTGTGVGMTTDVADAATSTSIVLNSAGTGTILRDDILTWDNDPLPGSVYRLTSATESDVSNGGTLTITPGLVTAGVIDGGITIKSDVINLVAAASDIRVIASEGATQQLTAAESGSTVLFDRAAGVIYTLPPAVVGLRYKFVTTVTISSNAATVLCTVGDFILGSIQTSLDAGGDVEQDIHFADGTADTGWASNGTTTGGILGGWVDVECITTSIWVVKGVLRASGTVANPIST